MKDSPSSLATITCRTEDGCRWRVLPPWESLLLARDGLRLDEWLADGRARRVKHTAGRSVYLVRLGERAVYVKHQRCGGPAHVLADLVRGSAARREWNGAIEALRRGVPTARPVALGESARLGAIRESYFITEAIEGAEPLDRLVLDRLESLSPERRRESRRLLLRRLARFVAAVHQAGLRHRDFHAGNLLVAPDELEDPARAAVYLIDLAGARFSGPLNWAATRANLITLHAEWFDRMTLAERWRFLRIYLNDRPELILPPRDALVGQLDRGARAHSRRIDRGRDRRALRNNRDFLAAGRRGQRRYATRDLPKSAVEQLCERPESVLLGALDRPVKISHTTLMVRAGVTCGGRSISVAFKRCRPRNAVKSLCDRFRRSRALRSWYYGHALLARGIDTARPLAVRDARRSDRPGRRRGPARWFAPRESYLAVEWIDAAENLHLWAWRLAERPPDERGRLASRCAESLGRLVGRMHARRISHRDLKGSNLLIAGDGHALRTWLIDTDGVRIHRHLRARRRAADLARLATSIEAHRWVSRSVRYRFLRAYAKQFPRGAVDERSLWRAVARRARRHVARKKREGKPLL